MFQIKTHDAKLQIKELSKQIKEIDLKLQKEKETESKLAKRKKKAATKKGSKNNEKTTDKKKVEQKKSKKTVSKSTKKSKVKKTLAIIILSIFSTNGLGVLAQNIPNITELTRVNPICIQEPFNDEVCIGVDPNNRLLFQHLVNPLFQLEIQSWEKRFAPCKEDPTICT